MRIERLMTTAWLALCLAAGAQTARAQKAGEPKNGEAQAVSSDGGGWQTLRFANRRDAPDCGLFLSYGPAGGGEESFAVRVSHLHHRSLWGKFKFPEDGWLYVTPSRVVFSVDRGDKSHAFDVPRSALKEKPATRFRMYFVGVQINLREKLAASDSREQKFVPSMIEDRKCAVENQKPYSVLLERTVNDFEGAAAEFRRLASSLKEAGKTQQTPTFVRPAAGPSATGR